MNFKITGMADAKHTVEMEDGARLHLDDRQLAAHKKEHTLLGTSDVWPNRPNEAPATQDAADLAPLKKQLAALGKEVEALRADHEALKASVSEKHKA